MIGVMLCNPRFARQRHLLAAALLSRTALWTRDCNLQAAAKKLGIAG